MSPHPCQLEEALVELETSLPVGWAWSITHVPSRGEWGGTASPVGPGVTSADCIQTDTCHSITDAVRALTAVLRQ